MRMYVIYEKPKDYPEHCVVRRWKIGLGTVTPDPEPRAVTSSLRMARESVPAGLHHLLPARGDDPVIVEMWM